MRKVAGFTLIEALVVITITGILLGVLLGNYRRSNENSLLIKETAKIMSYIRLAQETAASGKVVEYQYNEGDPPKFCENDLHKECVNDTDCTVSPRKCRTMPPPGGEVVLFQCASNDLLWYSEMAKCTSHDCFTSNAPTQQFNASDNIITHAALPASPHDRKRDWILFSSGINLRDIRISSSATPPRVRKCADGSDWRSFTTPDPTNSPVPNDRALAAAIQFTSANGDNFSAGIGRRIILSDNVHTTAHFDGTPWQKVEIMIGLTNRNTDCRVITMTDANVLTDSVDADCAF